MDERKPVKICSVGSRIEAEMVIDILRQNQIPAYRQPIGSAEVMDIYAGNSMFGEEIFVNLRDADRAKELTANIVEPEKNGDKPEREERKGSTGQVVFAVIVVLLAALLGCIFYFGL